MLCKLRAQDNKNCNIYFVCARKVIVLLTIIKFENQREILP